MAEQQEKTLKELQEEAKSLGMENPAVLMTKAQAVEVIKTLKAKEEVKPVVDNRKEDESRYLTKQQRMAKILEAQEQISYILPLEGKEKPGKVDVTRDPHGFLHYKKISGTIVPVQLNGYKVLVPKGVFVKLPQQVVDVLRKSQTPDPLAEKYSIERNETVKNKLA
jgi:hypothetical protein